MNDEPTEQREAPRRQNAIGRRMRDKAEFWGKFIGIVVAAAVGFGPTVYDVMVDRKETEKLREMVNQNRLHQMRILEEQLRESREQLEALAKGKAK